MKYPGTMPGASTISEIMVSKKPTDPGEANQWMTLGEAVAHVQAESACYGFEAIRKIRSALSDVKITARWGSIPSPNLVFHIGVTLVANVGFLLILFPLTNIFGHSMIFPTSLFRKSKRA